MYCVCDKLYCGLVGETCMELNDDTQIVFVSIWFVSYLWCDVKDISTIIWKMCIYCCICEINGKIEIIKMTIWTTAKVDVNKPPSYIGVFLAW
jgi:hypothetical protein